MATATLGRYVYVIRIRFGLEAVIRFRKKDASYWLPNLVFLCSIQLGEYQIGEVYARSVVTIGT